MSGLVEPLSTFYSPVFILSSLSVHGKRKKEKEKKMTTMGFEPMNLSEVEEHIVWAMVRGCFALAIQGVRIQLVGRKVKGSTDSLPPSPLGHIVLYIHFFSFYI